MDSFPSIHQFLAVETPQAWIDCAIRNQSILLIDHANCEKKAAQAALHLMFRYTEHDHLLQAMARLAREEILHFQKVAKLMVQRGVPYDSVSASRYVDRLRAQVRHYEPARLVDILIVGAFIEARSCERFHLLAPLLDEPLQRFYLGLYEAEQRHFQNYLHLAMRFSTEDITDRIAFFRAIEKDLIVSEDDEFRFHSGFPSARIRAS